MVLERGQRNVVEVEVVVVKLPCDEVEEELGRLEMICAGSVVVLVVQQELELQGSVVETMEMDLMSRASWTSQPVLTVEEKRGGLQARGMKQTLSGVEVEPVFGFLEKVHEG